MKLFNRRNNNGSNIIESEAKHQSGWGVITATASNVQSVAVSYPTVFTNVPIVLITFGGDTVGATSTLGSGAASVKNGMAEAIGLTTSGFTARIISDDSTAWTVGNTLYFHWIAIGV